MKLRQAAVLLMIPTLALGACKKRQPAGPAPDDSVGLVTDGGTGAGADSIRMAEQRRLEEERIERERVERERRLRETASTREALTDIVFFEYDSDQISGEAETKLQAKAEILRANPSLRLRIEGHADQRGSTEYNLALGQRRAEAVRAFLSAYGIDPDRFVTISYGKERPLDEGTDESAFARNRRAEFAIVGGDITVVPGGGR
jgi:peptidoglycan-associated lipoprotein